MQQNNRNFIKQIDDLSKESMQGWIVKMNVRKVEYLKLEE